MFFFKLIWKINSNSGFIIMRIEGIKWINKEIKIFCGVCEDVIILFLLWIIVMNIIKEKEAVINDIIKIIKIELLFHDKSLVIIIISLRVLIVGGAEIFKAENINHQNVMLGIRINNPLKSKMLRVWYLKYKSFTRRNKAEDDKPCPIIMIIAPVNPIVFNVNSPVNTKAMCATDE